MSSFILSKPLLVLLLVVFALFSISDATTSFISSDKNASFESEDFALYGDAKLVNGGSSIQLTDSVSHGGGRVVYNKPIESVTNRYSQYYDGFSTILSFSFSPGYGGRLGFFVFPVNKTSDDSLFEVKFDTSDNFTRNSSVMVIVDGATVPEKSEKIQNFTITNLEKDLLYAWINYQAGLKIFEVQLSKSKRYGDPLPLQFDQIDLSRMLNYEDEFMVGVNLYSGKVNLHSWSLEVRNFEHSTALLWVEEIRKEEAERKRRRERVKEIVTCFVMTFGSIGLVFFAVMQIWAAFKRNNHVMVMQEECGVKKKEFEYDNMDKFEVVISKADAKQERLLNSPVVFAHNDLLSGNLMLNEEEEKLHLNDFEYGPYNYRGFDIGDHFNNYAGYDCDYSLYPRKDEQYHFIKHYLQPDKPDVVSMAEVESVFIETNAYKLASHLYWAIWAIIQAKMSPIEFEYLDYFFFAIQCIQEAEASYLYTCYIILICMITAIGMWVHIEVLL